MKSIKSILVIIVLLFSLSGFSQTEKDALLLADKAAILDMLELMFYLDHTATKFLTMTKEQQTESDKTFPYYFTNTIVKNNPSSIDLAQFLGFDFKELKPVKVMDFCKAVYNRNLIEFISLTEKYGYLSNERLNRMKEGRSSALVVFVIHNSDHDKEVKKLMKQEFKKSNISVKEYDMFKFFLERKKVLTADDIKEIENKGGKVYKETF